jgi:hypothetical protein
LKQFNTHSLSGSVPFVMLLQVPSVPPVSAAAHASHDPLHALLQQKPSTQLPLPHWLDAVQRAPLALLHIPPVVQPKPGRQSAGVTHDIAHETPLHGYGEQSRVAGDAGAQPPRPSQCRWRVTTCAAHDWATHCVLAS